MRAARMRVSAIAMLGMLVASGCSAIGGGDDTYTVTAFFDRAVSLFENSQVRVLGLPAGIVSSVEVQGDRVKVDLEIDEGTQFPDFAQAFLRPRSLIGERVIEIFPAYSTQLADAGVAAAQDGHTLSFDDVTCGPDLETSKTDPQQCAVVPVEPDEALEALKEFLDALDPDNLGRLVDNGAGALDNNGQTLNRALGNVSQLLDLFAENDDTLVSILENVDEFSATLVTRETQLGEVMRAFAAATQVLADERDAIASLVADLGQLSDVGLGLVTEHGPRLDTTIDRAERLTEVLTNNLVAFGDSVTGLAGIAEGVRNVYNEELRAVNLRNNFGPLVADELAMFLDDIADLLPVDIDIPTVCIPIDATCPDGSIVPIPSPGTVLPPFSSVSSASGAHPLTVADFQALEAPAGSPGVAAQVGSFFRDAAKTLMGVG